MKITKLSLVIILLSLSFGLSAQQNSKQTAKPQSPQRKLEFSATAGYQFGGSLHDPVYGKVKFNDSDAYSFSLSAPIPIKWNSRIEFAFMNQNTSVSFRNPSTREYETRDIAVRYYQMGIIKEFPMGNLLPFAAFSLGALQVDPVDNHISNEWAFAVNMGAGAKYYFNDMIGLKIEGKLLAPIQFSGLYLNIGTGGPSSGVSAGSYTLQGYFGGGLVVNLVR